MNMYVVNITKYAEEQLREITHYITDVLKAPDSALHILELLENENNTLSQLPQRIVLVDEEPWHREDIHKMDIKNFIVYFWIDELKMIVHVTGIVYAKLDEIKQLLKMNME